MKNLIPVAILLCLMSCSNGANSKDIPKIKCDSVTVPMYDSAGNEMMVKELKCDTIKEQSK